MLLLDLVIFFIKSFFKRLLVIFINEGELFFIVKNESMRLICFMVYEIMFIISVYYVFC